MKILDQVIQFHNCYIVRGGKVIRDDLWTRNGKIINPEPLFFEEKNYADIRVDCGNILIAPGFIDVQLNGNIHRKCEKSSTAVKVMFSSNLLSPTGGFGIDFSDPNENISEGLKKVARGILPFGTTSFCPTLVTSSPEFYHKVCIYLKALKMGGTVKVCLWLCRIDSQGHSKNSRKCRGRRDFRCSCRGPIHQCP